MHFESLIAFFVIAFEKAHAVHSEDMRILERHCVLELLVIVDQEMLARGANASRDVVLLSALIAAFEAESKST